MLGLCETRATFEPAIQSKDWARKWSSEAVGVTKQCGNCGRRVKNFRDVRSAWNGLPLKTARPRRSFVLWRLTSRRVEEHETMDVFPRSAVTYPGIR